MQGTPAGRRSWGTENSGMQSQSSVTGELPGRLRRRRRLVADAVLACAWVMCLLTAEPVSASAVSTGPHGSGSWTVYHGDKSGTGVAGPVTSVDTSHRAWTSPALDGQIYGEPLVFGRRIYVATENDTVYALSAATGSVQWSAHLGSPVPATSLPCGD